MESSKANLPNLHQKIQFQEVGKKKLIIGKVKNKNKKNSKYRNVINMMLEDGNVKSYDFEKDILEWKDATNDVPNESSNDVCCLKSLEEEKDMVHDTYATILTKTQAKARPDAPKAIEDEIQKFKNF